MDWNAATRGLAYVDDYEAINGPITSYADFVAFHDYSVNRKAQAALKTGTPASKVNTVELATDVTSDFVQTRYYTAGGTDWPQRGDPNGNAPILNVPPTLWKRTIWLEISAFSATDWFWQGRLVAALGGMTTFQMPLLFARSGSATRHSLSVGWDQDNTGSIYEDKIQVNDAAGNPLIPFTFIASAQTIYLEQFASKIGTSDTRMLFMCRSQSIW